MKSLRQLFFLLIFFLPLLWKGNEGAALAQRGKNGTPPAITTNTVVNEYTALTANAAAGATSITVAASTLKANGRFSANLAPGDLIMIVQMQGATILGTLNVDHDATNVDSTWGAITAYNNCGNWEFAEVSSVPNVTSIIVDCPLINNYNAAGRTQVVRVPRYSALTINNGGVISCDPWLGTTGGICAIEVQNNTIINAGGSINTSGNGFRGGQILDNTNQLQNLFFSASSLNQDGSEKGEGIAGYETDYTPYGGMYMRGAPANGGGGGNIHNGGGGGGANGGNPVSWNGHGMPDNSVPGYISAWNLQYAGFSAQVSSGGGQGGYAWSANNQDPTAVGPCNAAWGGQSRCAIGGYGGRPLDYTTGKLFLGGGGGAGDQDNNEGGAGANGGGLIYLMNYGTVSGAGQIISNGNNGFNTRGASTFSNHRDGAGGGGSGGTIIINSAGAISGVSITANGGHGGNQLITAAEAEGPGGGGGGGYIDISNAGPVMTTNGGANGTTNSTGLGIPSKFPPNGATIGGIGTNTATITNFIINAANTTICTGQAATLTATLGGTPPGGTTIIWYDAIVGGNVLGNGGTLTTSVIATAGTYTYYVATCPGTYHQPVLVTATGNGVASAGPDATICTAGNTTLNASGGTGYSWSPAAGLNNPNISNPVASPVSTTTYVVTVTSSCGTATDTVIVNVNSSITANISGNTTICSGSPTTLTATGGGNYTWNTGATTASITVSPTTNTTYSVVVGVGTCTATTSSTVSVTPGITASVSPNTTVCPGSSVTIAASGGTTYSWMSGGATTSSITVAPTANTTYTVVVSSGTCSDTVSSTITTANNLNPTINGATNICTGGSTTLTASGGNNYLWNTAETTSSITVTPTANTTYSVLVSSGTCSGTATVTVNIGSNITASVGGNTSVCSGTSTTLTASGGTTYLWSNASPNPAIIVSPTNTSTYSVIVSSGSCKDTAFVTVNVSPAPVAAITDLNTVICKGDTSTLTASGGNTYSWNTGAITTSISVSPTVTTTYTVTAGNGTCTDTATLKITVLPPPNATIAGNPNICQGLAATLTATGGGSYLWSSGETTASINPNTAGTYSVLVSVGTCTAAASVRTTTNPNPAATVSPDINITQGQSTNLSASGGTTYVWDNGSTGANITVAPLVSTIYCVTVYDANNCHDTACVEVDVELCSNITTLYLPNAFSPNGDGENDELQIYYNFIQCIKTFHFVLYNRWGEKVFETSDPAFKWDGTYNKGLLNGTNEGNTEVYAYYMDVEIMDGTNISKKGNISLVR